MDNNNTQQQPPQGAQPAQPAQKPCPRNCAECDFQQHAYCAAKMVFDIFPVLGLIIEKVDSQAEVIAGMKVKLDAQSQERQLSSPVPVEGTLFTEKKQ